MWGIFCNLILKGLANKLGTVWAHHELEVEFVSVLIHMNPGQYFLGSSLTLDTRQTIILFN